MGSNISNNGEKTKTRADIWLSEGLQENAQQLKRGDAGKIAKIVKLKRQAIYPYLRGETGSQDTAKKILAAMRKIIIDRERSVKKLVA